MVTPSPAIGTTVVGATTLAVGGLMSSKGRRPGLSPQHQQSMERKLGAEGALSDMFQKRAKDPFAYVMPIDEQRYYDKRRLDIYGEGRGRQQQSLMGAMSRTGALASGATNYNLMRFGQETLRDQQQFYFQDRATRLKEKEQAVQSTYQMGMGILGAPTQGTEMTDVLTARNRQHNVWRNRWANVFTSTGGQMLGTGLGQIAGGGM